MKITIGKTAEGKNISFDLDTLLTTRLLIQANSGAGKSWLLRRLMEQLFGHVQVIVIDPEGEFATLREKFDYVLVGKGGETPIHLSTAEQVAHKLLELRASAVCDLYETPAKERHAWVRQFLESLIDAPKKLWHPVVIIVDEAQMFCPEKGESEAADAMVNLTTRGRKRGYCAVWATQRLANVNKDATSMLLNRLVGGTFEDVDLKRALELLSVPAEQKHAVAEELKTFDPGWFYAFGRAVTKVRLLFKVGDVQTSHPKPGSSKHAAKPPEPSAKVRAMLGALADIPKVAEEKAKTLEDFKRQVRELRTELAQAKKSHPKSPGAAADPVELKNLRSLVSDKTRRVRDLRAALEVLMKEATKITTQGLSPIVLNAEDFKPAVDRVVAEVVKIAQKKFDQRNGDLQALTAELRRAMPRLTKLLASTEETIAEEATPRVANEKSQEQKKVQQRGNTNGNDKPKVDGLNSRQVDILVALAKFDAMGRQAIDKRQIAAMAQVSHTSGHFGNNLGGLRSAGFIEYPQPGIVSLTPAGRSAAPEVDIPESAEEMLEHCKQVMNTAQGNILQILADAYPNSMEKADIAEKAGVSASSGNFGNNLGGLRSAGMISYPSVGTAKLESWVMLEA